MEFPVQNIEEIFHFMNNFYIPFINSKNYSSEVQETNLSEQHIQIIWNEFCKNKTFSSIKNEQIKVINVGQWNIEAGPDFKNATIDIDGEIKKGKVEIHLKPEQWYTHGHHWNSQYNDIILHVVWENPRKLSIPPNTPLIELKPTMQEFLKKAQSQQEYTYSQKFPYDENISHQLKNFDDKNISLIFQSAGLYRILSKSQKLTEEIIAVGTEQTFYKNFMEAMGYKNNRQQFLQLAQSANIEKLKNLRDNHQREAYLWGCSNLLPQILPSYEIHEEHKDFVDNLWKTWWTLRTGEEPIIQWSRQAQRPTNSPERRLAGSFSFFAKFDYDIKKIIKSLEKVILKKEEKITTLTDLLNGDSQWQHFYNFIKKSKTPMKLIGKSRCDDLLINLFIPFIIAINVDKNLTERKSLMNSLLKIPKLQNNIKLNLATNIFFIPPKRGHYTIKNAIEQQGLMQLFTDYQDFSEDKQSFWKELNINLKK